MILADVGNTHIHIYDGSRVEHLKIAQAIKIYSKKNIKYICVNRAVEEMIETLTQWTDISSQIAIEGAYTTMGVDRKALCLSRESGLFIDAGSAITIDRMRDGVYKGGFILAGFSATLKAYACISPALDTMLNRDISLDKLPLTTRDGISYGIIASIKAVIERERDGDEIFMTGGDGKFLSSYLSNATYDEQLVFQGIEKALAVSPLH